MKRSCWCGAAATRSRAAISPIRPHEECAWKKLHLSRPDLEGKKLSAVKSISYPAFDGTQIPAYLTLPPGVTTAKGLPALVLPHGGPVFFFFFFSVAR